MPNRWTRRRFLAAAAVSAALPAAGAAGAAGATGAARARPAPLPRDRPVIGLYNADDCREFGAVHADQSLRDLRAWAAAWGFTRLVEIGLSWPRVRSMRSSSADTPAHGLVVRSPAALAGRPFAALAASVRGAWPDRVAVTVSTHTPCAFGTTDADDAPGGGISVGGALVAMTASSLEFDWEWEEGFERFRTTPPSRDALRALGIVPHGRLGFPALGSSPRLLAELKLDPDVASLARRPDETLAAYYAREPLSAWCTRTARAAAARANRDEPHVVLPNAKFWSSPAFPGIPDAAHRLQARWLREQGFRVVDPSADWSGYGDDAARLLTVQIGAADGSPMRPWRRWSFTTHGPLWTRVDDASSRLDGYAERVDHAGGVARAPARYLHDAREGSYTLPPAPGDAVAHDTGNALAYDVRIDGRHVSRYVDGEPTERASGWTLDGDGTGTLRFRPGREYPPGTRVEIVRSHNRAPSRHRIDAFALYAGAGLPNGPVPGAPAALYPLAQNLRLRPGFHGFLWQSGTGTFAYEAFRRGATAMTGLTVSPRSFLVEPQVLLRTAILTGASLGEAHVLSPARIQHERGQPGRNVSIASTVYGDWMYAPYGAG